MSLVSIIIPVRNGERYLAEAIDSALAQEDARVEVIVVDDGSDDASAEIAASYGPAVRLERTPRRGAGAARNTGVALARGDHVAFLDADDLLTPRSVACRLEALRRSPAPGIVWGTTECFVSPDLTREEASRLDPPAGLMRARIAQGMLVSPGVLRQVGPFNPDLMVGEFIDWFGRAGDASVLQCDIEEVVVLRRLHLANTTRMRRAQSGDYVRALKLVLDRRRAEAGS